MCSWCGALVSSKSCREKKSMSFNITKNASPQNKARKAMGSDNSCKRVVSPRAQVSKPSIQPFLTDRVDGFFGASVTKLRLECRFAGFVFRAAGTTFDRRTIITIYAPRSCEAVPEGDPYYTPPGSPHSPLVSPFGEAKPTVLDRTGVRLDRIASRRLSGHGHGRPSGARRVLRFLRLRLRGGPRGDPVALLPGQHLEPADRCECRLRSG
jgi:hypothetical protein